MGGSFDNQGWSKCSDGHHLAGLYRNDCHSLYCIEMAKCCKPSDPVTSFPTGFPTSFPTSYPTSSPTFAAVNCVGAWGDFGVCTKTCGTGSKAKTFTITTKAAYGGEECKHAAGDEESAECATNECPEPVDIEMVVEETEASFTKQKQQRLINKIAKQMGIKAEEVQITVGLKANPTDFPARRLLGGLLITVTFNILPSKVTSEIAKLESPKFAKATGASFVQFKPSHGSSIHATCK